MTESIATELEEKRTRLRRWIPTYEPEAATQGVDHLAVFAKDLEVTAEFYSQVLGLSVVSVTTNRDVSESTHMNVAMGNGMTLAFFDFPHVARLRRKAPEGVGGIMHVALAVTHDQLDEIKERLQQRRVKFQEIGGSLYLEDPNGLGIELLPNP
jgi:catechol 2,3-dioxygenase-like lactoylglutathione lyase family enzyme